MESISLSEKTSNLLLDKVATARANSFLEKIDPLLDTLDQLCKKSLTKDANNVIGFRWNTETKKYTLFVDYEALLIALR
jgi:hypothetical protein